MHLTICPPAFDLVEYTVVMVTPRVVRALHSVAFFAVDSVQNVLSTLRFPYAVQALLKEVPHGVFGVAVGIRAQLHISVMPDFTAHSIS
jgi:hypothetical protein